MALKDAHTALKAQGLGLLIFDAGRLGEGVLLAHLARAGGASGQEREQGEGEEPEARAHQRALIRG